MQITARIIVHQLEQSGFKEVSVRGDHHKFRNNNGKMVIVPYSRLKENIQIGTYESILRQAGLKG